MNKETPEYKGQKGPTFKPSYAFIYVYIKMYSLIAICIPINNYTHYIYINIHTNLCVELCVYIYI